MRRNLIKLIMVMLLVTLISTLSWSATAKEMWQQGQKFLKQKNYTEAVTALEKAVELDEGNLVFLNWLGLAYLLNKQYDEAVGSFEKVKEKADVLVWNYYYGLSLLKSGKVNEAIVALEKSKKFKRANTSKINQALGQCYYEKDDLDKSEELIKSSSAGDPLLTGNKMYLGMIYLKRNEYLKAEEEFKNELTIPGDNLEERKTTMAQALVEFGYKKIGEGKFSEGEDVINSAATFDAEISKKGILNGYIKESDYLISQGKPAEAKEKLEKALELDPGNTNIQLKLDSIKGTDLQKYIVPVAGGIVGLIIVFIILIVIIKSSKKKKQAAADAPLEPQAKVKPAPVAKTPKPEEQATEVIEDIEEKVKEDKVESGEEPPAQETEAPPTPEPKASAKPEPVSEDAAPSQDEIADAVTGTIEVPGISLDEEISYDSIKDILTAHNTEKESVEKVKKFLIKNHDHVEAYKYLSQTYINFGDFDLLIDISEPFVEANDETKVLGKKVLEYAMKKAKDIRKVAKLLNTIYLKDEDVEKSVMLMKSIFDSYLDTEVNYLKTNLKILLGQDKKNIKVHYLFMEIYKFTKEDKMIELENQIIEKLKSNNKE